MHTSLLKNSFAKGQLTSYDDSSSDLVHVMGYSVKILDSFLDGSLELRQNSEFPNSEVLGVSCCLCMSSINLKQRNQASQA